MKQINPNYVLIANLLQAEAVKVAKLLAVPENVTIQVTPSKPEFFSWKSQIMQAYVKGGSLTLGILWILGIIYELIRRYRRNKPKIIPKTRKSCSQQYFSSIKV